MIEVIVMLDVDNLPNDIKLTIENLLWEIKRKHKINSEISQINYIEVPQSPIEDYDNSDD